MRSAGGAKADSASEVDGEGGGGGRASGPLPNSGVTLRRLRSAKALGTGLAITRRPMRACTEDACELAPTAAAVLALPIPKEGVNRSA